MKSGVLIVLALALLATEVESREVVSHQTLQFNPMDILNYLLGYGTGILGGLLDVVGHNNAAKCFTNYVNVSRAATALYDLFRNGFSNDVPTYIKLLNQTIAMLNITIQEFQYCYSTYSLGYIFGECFYYMVYWFWYWLYDFAYNLLHYSWYIAYEFYQFYLALGSTGQEAENKQAYHLARGVYYALLNKTYGDYVGPTPPAPTMLY